MSIFENAELEVRVSEGDGKILATFIPSADLPPFNGHFPGNPILPGIAQIALITEILDRANANAFLFTLDTVKRVKFLAPIVPGMQVSAEVSCRPGEEDGIVCAEAVLRADEKKISVLKLLYRRQTA